MTYYNNLAYELRLRNYPDAEVTPILSEVHSFSLQEGSSPEAAFGKPGDYAKTFPARKRKLPIYKVTTLLYVAAALFGAFALFAGDLKVDLGPAPILLIVLPFVLVVSVLAIVMLHRLPPSFKEIMASGRAHSGR